MRSAFRARGQHCNLRKYPWEPGIFFNPVSSVFGMAWLGLPQRPARHLTLNLWSNLRLGAAKDGRAALASSNPALPGTHFSHSFLRCGTLIICTGLICNFSPTIQVNARQGKVHTSEPFSYSCWGTFPVPPCTLWNCPLEKPKALDNVEPGWNC